MTASADEAEPSWVQGTPVLSGERLYERGNMSAGCTVETIDIVGSLAPTNQCIVTGKGFSVDTQQQYIRIGSDAKYRRVYGLDAGFLTQKIIPQTNVLVRRLGYTMFTQSAELTINKDVMGSLSPAEGQSPLVETYTYEHTVDFTLADANHPIYVAPGMGYSNNGRWLVVELMGVGLARIDLENDFKAELFSTLAPRYYVGSNPSMRFAVSDDGTHVAVSGPNTPFMMYQIDEQCTKLIGAHEALTTSGYTECPHVSLQEHAGFTDWWQYPYAMRFGSSPYELQFIAGESAGPSMCGAEEGASCEVVRVLHASGYDGSARLNYLAMGDSLSSGEGDIAINPANKKKYYQPFTDNEGYNVPDVPREKCHLSSRAYPLYAARAMGLTDTPRQWGNIACSGAKVSDAYTQSYGALYSGQAKGGISLESGTPRLEGRSDKKALQTAALNEMIPGRVQQIEFVKKYKPRIITLTMGANDVDFGAKLTNCVFFSGVCGWATTKKSALASQIQGQYDKLRSFYEALYTASGNQAKIYVLGYPQIISNAEPAHCGWNIGSLNKEERAMIYDATTYLNLVIERAANAAGVTYVGISDALDGGRLCDDGQRYMTGVAYRGSNEIQESFHPNDYGHVMIASKVRQRLDNKTLDDYVVCGGRVLMCPKTGASAEKPAIPQNLGGAPDRPSRSAAFSPEVMHKDSRQLVQVEARTLRPGSSLSVELHSDPIDLGQFAADASGGLSEQITIPATVPAGYHTLVMTGQTYSGEPIDFMQTVLVIGDDPNDVDENGIADDWQPCGVFMFIPGDERCGVIIKPADPTSTPIAAAPGDGAVSMSPTRHHKVAHVGEAKRDGGADVAQEAIAAQNVDTPRLEDEAVAERVSTRDLLSKNEQRFLPWIACVVVIVAGIVVWVGIRKLHRERKA